MFQPVSVQLISYRVTVVRNDPLEQLANTKKVIRSQLISDLKLLKGLKSVTTLRITFVKQNNVNELIIKQAFFNSRAQSIFNENDIVFVNSTNQLVSKIGSWLSIGSGWTIKSIDEHYFNIVWYSPLNAGSYMKLPKEFRLTKRGLIIIKNLDNRCFLYCHLAQIHQNKVNSNREKVSHCKKYIKTVNYDGIELPVTIKDVPKIERQN